MELDHVEAFVAIIRRGGFSRAATTLGGQHLADVFVLDLTRVDTLNPRHRFRVLSDASSGPGGTTAFARHARDAGQGLPRAQGAGSTPPEPWDHHPVTDRR